MFHEPCLQGNSPRKQDPAVANFYSAAEHCSRGALWPSFALVSIRRLGSLEDPCLSEASRPFQARWRPDTSPVSHGAHCPGRFEGLVKTTPPGALQGAAEGWRLPKVNAQIRNSRQEFIGGRSALHHFGGAQCAGFGDVAGIEMKMFGIAIDPTQSTTRIFDGRRRQCRSGHAIVDIDRLSALPPPYNSRLDCIPVGQIIAHLIVDIPYFGHSFVPFDDKRNMYDMITI